MMRKILSEKLNMDWKIALVTVVSTLLITADRYYSPTNHNYYDSLIYYIVIPLGIVLLIFREKPSEWGFSFGDWKLGVLL